MLNDSAGHLLLWEAIQQKEIYPIFRLIYLSKPTAPFTDAQLDDIEDKSVTANNARDVTGLLIVHGDHVLQILEGPEEAVRELYAKIKADSRHTISKLVSEVEDEERLLLTWSMVVREITNIPAEISKHYEQVYGELLHAESPCEMMIDHIDLFKAISLLAPLPVLCA